MKNLYVYKSGSCEAIWAEKMKQVVQNNLDKTV